MKACAMGDCTAFTKRRQVEEAAAQKNSAGEFTEREKKSKKSGKTQGDKERSMSVSGIPGLNLIEAG